MSTSPQELLQQGIAAARAGDTGTARQLIAKALQLDPLNEQAWLWLTSVAQDDEERIRILSHLLTINPNNEHAIRGLQALGALPPAEPEPTPEPPTPEEGAYADDTWVDNVIPTEADEAALMEPAEAMPEEAAQFDPSVPFASPVVTAPPPPAPQGIPMIEPSVLAYVQQAAEAIVNEALAEQEEVTFGDVVWVATRETVREKPRVTLNPLLVGGAVGGLVILAGIVFGIYSLVTRPRSGPVLPEIASGPRATPVATATHTPAPSPTATLLPGQPTLTPEATIAIGVPHGDLDFGLTPTVAYFATVHPDNPPLDDAIEKYRLGDYEAAIEEIPAARESGPDLPDSYYFEGMAYAHLGQYQRAASAINQGLGQAPNMAALHAALGYIYFHDGNLDESRIENQTAKSLDPVLILPYLTLAEDYREAELYESALAEVEAALELDAHNVEVLVAQAEIYMAQGDPASASAIGNLAVYIDPTSEAAVLLLGRARIALEQYGQAVAPLEQYLSRVNPASAAAWSLLGEARYLEGNQQQALDAFSKALLLSEDSSEVLVKRGNVFLATGAYEDAYTDFDEAVSLDDTTEARYGRAQAAFATGRYDRALDDIEVVLDETPLDPEARLLRAEALVETEDYEDAHPELTALEGVEFADPATLGDVLEYRGRANYYLTFYGDAIIDLERAIEIEETGTRHFYRGLALEATNNVEGAILEYDWVLFWDHLYDYPFADEAAERRENLNAGGDPQGAPGF